MIVLLCAALLVSIAVPNLNMLRDHWSLWGGARVLEASLQWGRMHAVSANTPMLFRVADDRQTFWWADPVTGETYEGSLRRLAAGLHIVKAPAAPLRFYPHGNAAPGGTYTIQGERGAYSVVVAPGGRIRIQKN